MFIIIFGGMQMKKCFTERTAVLFMGLFFFFPFAMSYSIEVRMYSLAAAFVFSCAVFAYKFWLCHGGKKNLAGLVIFGVLAAYTHYFAFVSICVIYGLLLIATLTAQKNMFKKWVLAVVASIILYAPWFPSFIHQLAYKVNHEYWIGDITINTMIDYFDSLFGAGGIDTYTLFFSATYLTCLIWILYSKEKKEMLLCICCILVPAGTLTVGVLASVLVRPVFIIRYLVPSVPLLVAFMAIVLGKVNNAALLSAILSITLMGGISHYEVTLGQEYTDYNYVPVEEYSDVDAYIVDNGHIAWTLGYYVTDTSIYYGDGVTAYTPYPNFVKMEDFDSDKVNKAIMLMYGGNSLSNDFYEMYNVEDIGEWRCEYNVNAYLLTKKK
jgi:uncharacterized membrane protein